MPAHLRELLGSSSRKGKQLTPAQLLARKPRVELTLKRKCEIIDEAKKRGFKPDSMERTLNRVNQTQLQYLKNLVSLKKTLTGYFGKQRTSSRNF